MHDHLLNTYYIVPFMYVVTFMNYVQLFTYTIKLIKICISNNIYNYVYSNVFYSNSFQIKPILISHKYCS